MPYRDELEFRSDAIEMGWRRPDREAPRTYVVEHAADELPEQKRLSDAGLIGGIGGLFGLLATLGLVFHRFTRRPRPVTTRLTLTAEGARCRRGPEERVFPAGDVRGFGAGRDTAELRTVFVKTAQGRELVLEGLPAEDAARAVEYLERAFAELTPG